MKQHSFLYFLSRFAAGDIREFLGLVTPDPPSMAPVMALTTSLTALRLMAALSPLSLERKKNQSFEKLLRFAHLATAAPHQGPLSLPPHHL